MADGEWAARHAGRHTPPQLPNFVWPDSVQATEAGSLFPNIAKVTRMRLENRFLMLRTTLYSNCPGFLLLLLLLTSCQAQTLSNCRPAPPMPPNVKPGVDGLSLSRDGKTLVVAGGDAKIRFGYMTNGEVQR